MAFIDKIPIRIIMKPNFQYNGFSVSYSSERNSVAIFIFERDPFSFREIHYVVSNNIFIDEIPISKDSLSPDSTLERHDGVPQDA